MEQKNACFMGFGSQVATSKTRQFEFHLSSRDFVNTFDKEAIKESRQNLLLLHSGQKSQFLANF